MPEARFVRRITVAKDLGSQSKHGIVSGGHMSAPTIRRLVLCASIAVVALSSPPAVADLPQHPLVGRFGPLQSECCPSDEPDPFAEAHFGYAVAIRNEIAFIGIESGLPTPRVAVLTRTTAGWARTGTITPPDAASERQFGRAITFRDGLVIIASAAAVHVFKRINGAWTAIQKITPPAIGPAYFRDFPTEAALRYENGILAIGAISNSPLGNVVYIYELNAQGKLMKRATLKPSDASPNDLFGTDVGVAGNTVAVGAPGRNAAYVFKRRSDGRWVQAQKLLTADTPARGEFGAAVAIDRGMIIVGAPEFDCDGGIFCRDTAPPADNVAGGAAFGFVSIAGQYVELFKLRPRPDESFGFLDFGYRIAMSDKRIVVAANKPYGAILALPFGQAFTYTRDGTNVSARGLAHGYVAANCIGLSNNALLVGSPRDEFRCGNTFGCTGDASLFDLSRFTE